MLAERIGVTTQYLGMVERNKSSPSFELVDRIAQEFKRHPAELFLPTMEDVGCAGASNLNHARPDTAKVFLAQGSLMLSEVRIDPTPGFSQDSVILLDANFTVLAADSVVATHLGTPLKEIIGKDISAFLPPDVAAYCREILLEALRSGRHIRFRDRLRQTEFEHDVYPIVDEPGSPVLLAMLSRDITGQRLRENVLLKNEDHSRVVAHGALDALVLMDQDGNAAFWNPAAERLLGWKAEEVLGRDLHERIVPPELLELARKGFQDFRKTGSGPIIGQWREIEALHKDGTRLPVEMVCSGVMTDRGWHAVAVLRDISELKRRERAREDMKGIARHNLRGQIDGLLGLLEFLLMDQELPPRQRKVLESIQDAGLCIQRLINFPEAAPGLTQTFDPAILAKYEFLANISHGLRTPLNGILGVLQILESCSLSKEQHELVALAITSAQCLNILFGDLLDLAKLDTAKLELRVADFDLDALLASIVGLFTLEAERKGLALDLQVDPATPRQLLGDERRLRQTLFNLVENALQFTERGRVAVEVSVPDRSPFRILFTVRDTGIGISEDLCKAIFEPFVQVDSVFIRRHQGAGLGLAIVKRLVALMEGEISIESVEGQGTSVHVSLPFGLMETAQRPAGNGGANP